MKSVASVLEGIRVVDFSWVVAGPLVTRTLAALGAEVIKIESSTRPEFVNRTGNFPFCNQNKKSCQLNFTKPDGQRLIRELVAKSDIIVENFSAGVLGKYRLGYEDMKASRQDIIYVSSSGLGRAGPFKDFLAYGSLLQGFSGRAAIINEINPRLEAMGVKPAWTDPVTALWELLAILACVYNRRRTGEGAYIDLSMLESTVSLIPEALLREVLTPNTQGPGGNRETDAAPSGCFRCSDGDQWLALSVRSDAEWVAFCNVVGRPDLGRDSRYASLQARLAAKRELDELAAAWLSTIAARDAQATLIASGVPAARSRNIVEVMNDPRLVSRGVYHKLSDGADSIGLPWRDADGWRGDWSPTPRMGADNDYVYQQILGLSEADMAKLKAEGVIE